MPTVTRWIAIALVAACGGSGHAPSDAVAIDVAVDVASCPDAGVPAMQLDCGAAPCAATPITGDPIASAASGSFRGYANPTIAADPATPGRIWLAYSWPDVVPGTAPNGTAVQMGAVASHLARSDDRGQTFAFVADLWPSVAATDPEGSAENGLFNSEVPSLATMVVGGTTYWFGAHLCYFQQPKSYYFPKYATSWTVHVGAALSPDGLATAPEAVLGVSTTASVYQPNVALDQLAGVPIQSCAILNNPSLYARDATLYLLVECLAFSGATADLAHKTLQVFATTPSGAPSTWTWRHAGVLGDATLAHQLGADTLENPTAALATDGTLLGMFSLAHQDASSPTGTTPDGCVVVELASIDPPALAHDCAGNPVVRARITGAGDGACTYDRTSRSGVIITSSGSAGWRLNDTGVQP